MLNGTYLGNYQVSDQVNVDNKRVEVYEQEDVATDTTNITGGYLVEVDGFGTSEPVYFRTNKNLIVSVKSPDEDVINNNQKNYIKEYLNHFETALFSTNFTDPPNGYRAIADSTTLISWYIATELSANVDGFWSTYLYKDRNDPKLYFGPLWNYDIAYNNCNRIGDAINRTMVDAAFGDDLTKVWVKRMIKDPWFNVAVNNAWKQKVNEGLEEYLYNYIDSMATYIDQSQEKNYNRYSISSHVYNEIYLYSTYAEYIEQLKGFISAHMNFLTNAFAERANDQGNGQPIELKPFELQEKYYYRIYNRGTNKVLDIANQSTEQGANVVIWSPEYGRDTQLWQITKVGDAYQLINKASGMAFNDPSPTPATGTKLNVAIPNMDDNRQLWHFVTVNENGNYNIINTYTDHAINNSGGGSSDGNNILSYTNDDRNSVSNNRHWRITPEELIPDYIPEEVKETLAATIAEAETFIRSLSDEQIGNGIFCYQAEVLQQLQQMINEALHFESTIADDYILVNVNLAKQLAIAQQQNMPDPNQRYIIHHIESGYYLNVNSSELHITTLNHNNTGQHFTFKPTGNGNGLYIKSENDLYPMLSQTGNRVLIGNQHISDETKATFEISITDDYYIIHTKQGLLGTDENDDLSQVYGNYTDNTLSTCWSIEKATSELDILKHELGMMITEAQNAISNINSQWIGTAPMQHSQANIDALSEVIEEALSHTFTTVEEYREMLAQIAKATHLLHTLNAPDEKDYYLRHRSAYNLTCNEGLTFNIADTLDATQRFRLMPVPESINTYYIYTNGMYVTVTDDANATLALTDTPRDEQGQFIAAQVAPNQFTLQSIVGYLGSKQIRINAGEACMSNATDNGNNIRWQLVESTNAIIDDVIDPLAYMPTIDYAITYNKRPKLSVSYPTTWTYYP